MNRPGKHVSFTSLIQALRKHCASMPEHRHNGKLRYSLPDIILSAFACMFFQDRSLLQFQRRMQDESQSNNVTTCFGVEKIPEDTQLRDVLDKVNPENFRPIFYDYFSRLQRGKHLEQFRIFGNRYLISIDGTQYFTSNSISCEHCLTREHKEEETSYHHQALQAAIVHPDCKQVIPLMPEDICNKDDQKKQDCELNAAKRLIPALRKDHPQLGIILLGDGLYSNNPMIEMVKAQRMDFIFTAKPDDHKYMMTWIADCDDEQIQQQTIIENNRTYLYRWINDVPLNAREDSFSVNYLQLEIFKHDKNGENKRSYRSSWVTNIELSHDNIILMVKAARCRWKIENECFNNLKNQGYNLEHNFGHGAQFLAYNFYVITLLAFFFHQILELTCEDFQEARRRWSKFMIWERLRFLVNYIHFTSWEQMLHHCIDPPRIVSTAPL